MNAIATLETILRDYPGAVQNPKLARAILFARSTFADSFVATIVWEIMAADGDWRKALRALPYDYQKANKQRLEKFRAWAEKITRREVRGLITNGGAS